MYVGALGVTTSQAAWRRSRRAGRPREPGRPAHVPAAMAVYPAAVTFLPWMSAVRDEKPEGKRSGSAPSSVGWG